MTSNKLKNSHCLAGGAMLYSICTFTTLLLYCGSAKMCPKTFERSIPTHRMDQATNISQLNCPRLLLFKVYYNTYKKSH